MQTVPIPTVPTLVPANLVGPVMESCPELAASTLMNAPLKQSVPLSKCFATPMPHAPTLMALTLAAATMDTPATASLTVPDVPISTSALTIHMTVTSTPHALTLLAHLRASATSAGKATATPVPTLTSAAFLLFATHFTTATSTPAASTLTVLSIAAVMPVGPATELLAQMSTNVLQITTATRMLLALILTVLTCVHATPDTVATDGQPELPVPMTMNVTKTPITVTSTQHAPTQTALLHVVATQATRVMA
jgi:hypothetical protein